MENKGTHKTISDRDKDGRVKISDKDKEAIILMYNATNRLRATAREFGVSPMTVYYIVNPDKLESNRKLLEEKGGSKIYTTPESNRIKNQKYYTKKLEMQKDIMQQNIFYVLRGLQPTQIVNRITMKDKSKLHDCTVTNNDTDHKQLEINTTLYGDSIIDYSNIESIIFKSK